MSNEWMKANKININPAYFLVPCTLCVSFAVMFPVATQPNTVVFGSGYISVKDMVYYLLHKYYIICCIINYVKLNEMCLNDKKQIISGIGIKLVGFVVLFLAANVWLDPLFASNGTVANSTVSLLTTTLAYDNGSLNLTSTSSAWKLEIFIHIVLTEVNM